MKMRKIINLLELQKIQTNKIKSLRSANEILISNGFKLIGYGMMAKVYSHPGLDYVLKVFNKDDGYQQFWKLACQYNNNPHFPKFRGKLMQIVPNIYAVRMEKLQKATINNIGISPEAISKFMNNYIIDNTDNYEYYNLDQKLLEKITSYIEETQPLLLEALDLLKKYDAFEDTLDLHDENFMMRNNTIVITDPFWAG